MQVSQIALFGLLGLAAASPVEKRTVAQIVSDISTVSGDVTAFDSSLTSFNGNLIQAIALLKNYVALTSDLSTLQKEVTSTGTLGNSDSATVYSDMSGLSTGFTSFLGDANGVYTTIKNAGYASFVCNYMSTLATDVDNVFVALEKTVDSAYTSQVTTLQNGVDSAFKTTTNTYGC